MICTGEEENIDLKELKAKALQGFDALHPDHKKEWREYFSTCDIDIPDKKLLDLYKFNRYVSRAHQHPTVGLISLGMLPNLWRGGIACGYDQVFPHEAFLTSGNFTESKNSSA